MSYFTEGQRKTDKDNRMSGQMTIIPFPVLFKCPNALKRTKTTKIKCKDDLNNQIIKKKIKVFDSFESLTNLEAVHTSFPDEGQCSTDKDNWKFIIKYTNFDNSISCLGWN